MQSKEFLKILGKQGIVFKLDSKVTGVSLLKNKVVVDFTNNKNSKTKNDDKEYFRKVLPEKK